MSADFAALMSRQSVATNDSFRSFASPLFHAPLSHTLKCGRCQKKEGAKKERTRQTCCVYMSTCRSSFEERSAHVDM